MGETLGREKESTVEMNHGPQLTDKEKVVCFSCHAERRAGVLLEMRTRKETMNSKDWV